MATAHGEITLTENSYDITGNYSNVTANFYVVLDSGYAYSGYETTIKCTLDGTSEDKTVSSYNLSSSNNKVLLATITKNINHDSDGKKTVSASFSWDPENSTLSTVTGSASLKLTDIPRYASLSHSLSSQTIDTVKIKWSSDSTCDRVQYKIGTGNWITASSSSAKSGTYTISGLNPNTKYSIYTRVRRADSQLQTESSALSVTTYDIAKISSASNFYLGSNASVTITNPASATATLVMKVGSTQILSKNLATGANTISFTDAQLDNIYKEFTTTNSVTISYTLTTNNNSKWTNSKSVICTLNGNQKTGHVNVSTVWRRTKGFINISGSWKNFVVWINKNGSWRRCI